MMSDPKTGERPKRSVCLPAKLQTLPELLCDSLSQAERTQPAKPTIHRQSRAGLMRTAMLFIITHKRQIAVFILWFFVHTTGAGRCL